jgi:hypothetical protein
MTRIKDTKEILKNTTFKYLITVKVSRSTKRSKRKVKKQAYNKLKKLSFHATIKLMTTEY